MPITIAHQPSYQQVAQLAFWGAAGNAARMNWADTLRRQQQYSLSQQGMALQREGMYRQSFERALDRQFQAQQGEAANQHDLVRMEKADELGRGRTMLDFTLSQEGADNALLRSKQLALEQLEKQAEIRRQQFDYEQDADDQKLDAARKAVIQDGRYTDDERLDALLQIEAERANLQNFKLPKKRTMTLRHQLFGDDPQGQYPGTVIKDDRGTFWQQPDGQVEFRPADKQEPPITFKDYSAAFSSIAANMATERKDAQGNIIGIDQPDPTAVNAQMATMLNGYQQFLQSQQQQQRQISGGATTPAPQPPTPQPPQAPAPQQPAPMPPSATAPAPGDALLPRPRNQAEYDKIKSGTTFIAPDGTKRIKP